MVTIGAILGSLLAIFIADRQGRKDALIFSNVPTICGWLFIIYASVYQEQGSTLDAFLALLFVGRFLTGIGAGWTSVVVPVSLYNCLSN